jgi:GT2 family glycosyltransferase
MVSRVAHNAIGGFDERYFLYGEDLDYWHRLRLVLRVTEFRPELVIDHATSTGSPLGAAHREVLRWLGVELFAETYYGTTWRRMRVAHRLVLPVIGRACPELAERVARCWRAEERPSTVLRELRPFLEDGLARLSRP